MAKNLLVLLALFSVFFCVPCIDAQEKASRVASKAQAEELFQKARKTYSQEGPRQALVLFEQALEVYRVLDDRLGESIVLGFIGNCPPALANSGRVTSWLTADKTRLYLYQRAVLPVKRARASS